MKPTLQTEDIKQNVATITQMPEDQPKTPRSRWIIVGVIVVVLVMVVAVTAIAAFYLGSKTSKDNYKESWVTFSNQDHSKSVTTKVVVTESEEDVTSPGVSRIIYDHKRKQMVTQYDSPIGENDDAFCYVMDWDPQQEKDDADANVMEQITSENMTRVVTFDNTTYKIKSTTEEVDISLLSPRAQEMCMGCTIVRAVQEIDNGKGRKKRFCNFWNCTWHCFWLGCKFTCDIKCSW